MAESKGRSNVRWGYVREQAARVLEKYHDGSLPVNIEVIAEKLGLTVQPVQTEDSELAGYFVRDPVSGRSVVGVNSTNSKVRQRFTLAHELGHAILHSTEDLRYDRKGYSYDFGKVMMRNEDSRKGENPEEVEANFFAAEVLMPRHILLKRLSDSGALDFLETESDSVIRQLAREFNVSVQALTVRLIQLNVIEPY